MLSAHHALQWQQQQQHRANSSNQPYAKDNRQQSMLAATSTMHNGHNPSTSQNGNGDLPSCTGCRELRREIDELKRIMSFVVELKPEAAAMCGSAGLFGLAAAQRSVPGQQQQFVVDNCPFNLPLVPNVSHIARLLQNSSMSHVNHNANGVPYPAMESSILQTFLSMAASTSGNTMDLAHSAVSVEANGDNNFVDPVNIEASETSSSSSSANVQVTQSPTQTSVAQLQALQAMISPRNHQHQSQTKRETPPLGARNSNHLFNNNMSLEAVQRLVNNNLFNSQLPHSLGSATPEFAAAIMAAANSINGAAQQAPLPPSMPLPLSSSMLANSLGRPHSRPNGVHERSSTGGPVGGISERKKASTDDFVKNIRQCQMTDEEIRQIEIPVPEAYKYDQNFRPVDEHQIINSIMSSKKDKESMNVQDTMIQLCKKLAEKRVFGSRLMADTTVAAPNHSNYTNLPEKGIIYIKHVCQIVLGPRVKNEDQFWEFFRDAMRKLAARCRRVRHAKKRSNNASGSHLLDGSTNGNTMVSIASSVPSPSIFASAQSLVDDERSSRSSTSSNPALLSGTTPFNRSLTPLSGTTATLTPSSSNTSPTEPGGASPSDS